MIETTMGQIDDATLNRIKSAYISIIENSNSMKN